MLTYLDGLWAGAGLRAEYRQAMRLVLALGRPKGGEPRQGVSVADLPSLCCEAAGGTQRRAGPVAVAWQLLYVAAHLLDDMEDGDGETSSPNELGARINVATGLIESASLVLCDLETVGAGVEAASVIRREFHQTVLTMCDGQHADLTQPERTLERCWGIAEAKSGAFFALACRAGARLAASTPELVQAFDEFGGSLGVLVQIRNEAGGLAACDGRRGDLVTQRWTLPIIYAMQVLAAPERDQLHTLLRAAPSDARAEAEARRQVVASGALLYLAAEAERRRQLAASALCQAAPPSPARTGLLALLDTVAGGVE